VRGREGKRGKEHKEGVGGRERERETEREREGERESKRDWFANLSGVADEGACSANESDLGARL